MQRNNVLFVSAEMADFVKTGGLGDVAAALPRALQPLCNVRVLIPGYTCVMEKGPWCIVKAILVKGNLPHCHIGKTVRPDGLVVYAVVSKRGYRIQPQYQFEGYRMDMVVWDDNGNFAVLECDGDTFHDVDKADSDNVRENFLAANGFRFVRFYFSEMKKSPKALWDRIDNELTSFGVEKSLFPQSLVQGDAVFG